MTSRQVRGVHSSKDRFRSQSRLQLADVYDICFVHDPQAKKSTRVRICIVGDNDLWFEKIVWNEKDSEWISYFVSRNTGRMVKDEPPTGASRVIYLTYFYRMLKMREHHRAGTIL